MTLTIELEPEVERQLEIEAARLGITKEECVVQIIKAELARLKRERDTNKMSNQDDE